MWDVKKWTLLNSPFELLNLYSLQNLLNCCWLFSTNAKDTYIGPVYCRKITVPRDIVYWLGDILHVVMFTLLYNNTERSSSWWKINSDFKYIIFDEGMVWEIDFNVGRVERIFIFISSEPSKHPLLNLLLCSSIF